MNSGLVSGLASAPLRLRPLRPGQATNSIEALNGKASGTRSIAFGGTASGSGAVAIGGTASGEGSIAFGPSTVTGPYASGFGYNNSSGYGSFTGGFNCTNNANYFALFGNVVTINGSAPLFGFACSSRSTINAYGNGRSASFVDLSYINGDACFSFGRGIKPDRLGLFLFNSDNTLGSTTQGETQSFLATLDVKTTDATPKVMVLYWGNLIVPTGKGFAATIRIIGVKSDGSAWSDYYRKAAIKNIAGTTSLIGSVEPIGTDYEDNSLTDVSITANDTNSSLDITVTGIDSEIWRWTAYVSAIEISYGT